MDQDSSVRIRRHAPFLVIVTVGFFISSSVILTNHPLRLLEVSRVNDKYEDQLYLWIHYMKTTNLSNTGIARQVFGMGAPREGVAHTYPFLTHDTLRAWIDWDYDHKRRSKRYFMVTM